MYSFALLKGELEACFASITDWQLNVLQTFGEQFQERLARRLDDYETAPTHFGAVTLLPRLAIEGVIAEIHEMDHAAYLAFINTFREELNKAGDFIRFRFKNEIAFLRTLEEPDVDLAASKAHIIKIYRAVMMRRSVYGDVQYEGRALAQRLGIHLIVRSVNAAGDAYVQEYGPAATEGIPTIVFHHTQGDRNAHFVLHQVRDQEIPHSIPGTGNCLFDAFAQALIELYIQDSGLDTPASLSTRRASQKQMGISLGLIEKESVAGHKRKIDKISGGAKAGPKPRYVANIAVHVPSDDEAETSSGEDKETFPEDYYSNPLAHFRLLPSSSRKQETGEEVVKLEGVSLNTRGQVNEEDVTPSAAAKAYKGKKGQDRLAAVINRDALKREEDKTARLALCFGLNKMRSLSNSRNQALESALKKRISSQFLFERFGFFWDGVWLERSKIDGPWRSVPYARVQQFYRQLKNNNAALAETFRQHVERHRGHMIPYREIRERVKNHPFTRAMIAKHRKRNAKRDVYLAVFDSDMRGMRGTMESYDHLYRMHTRKKTPLELASTGYRFSPDSHELITLLGAECDLSVRHATAKYIKAGVYYPEPSSIIRIRPGSDGLEEAFTVAEDGSVYKSPQEIPNIMKDVITKRGVDPQTSFAFTRRGAVITTIPERMKRKFRIAKSIDVEGDTKIINWGLPDLQTIRGLEQNHYNARDWAINILNALDYRSENRNILISLISRLFKAYDPVERARMRCASTRESFQQAFIEYLLDPDSRMAVTVLPFAEKRDTAARTKFKKYDQINTISGLKTEINALLNSHPEGQYWADLIEAAARDSAAALEGVLRQHLHLEFSALCIQGMEELCAKKITLPIVYKAILNNTLIDDGQKTASWNGLNNLSKEEKLACANTEALHWAALVGNLDIINWLKGKRLSIHVPAENGILPIHCAVHHCIENGSSFALLEAFLDSRRAYDLPSIQIILKQLIDVLKVDDVDVVEELIDFFNVPLRYESETFRALFDKAVLVAIQEGEEVFNPLLIWAYDRLNEKDFERYVLTWIQRGCFNVVDRCEELELIDQADLGDKVWAAFLALGSEEEEAQKNIAEWMQEKGYDYSEEEQIIDLITQGNHVGVKFLFENEYLAESDYKASIWEALRSSENESELANLMKWCKEQGINFDKEMFKAVLEGDGDFVYSIRELQSDEDVINDQVENEMSNYATDEDVDRYKEEYGSDQEGDALAYEERAILNALYRRCDLQTDACLGNLLKYYKLLHPEEEERRSYDERSGLDSEEEDSSSGRDSEEDDEDEDDFNDGYDTDNEEEERRSYDELSSLDSEEEDSSSECDSEEDDEDEDDFNDGYDTDNEEEDNEYSP